METIDRKSTRLNSSHRCISYAVFCLKKKRSPGPLTGHPPESFDESVCTNRAAASDTGRRYSAGPVTPRVPAPSASTRFFFFNDTATTEIYTLSLHDALPIYEVYRAGLEWVLTNPIEACTIDL